jgi:hypothetical protein
MRRAWANASTVVGASVLRFGGQGSVKGQSIRLCSSLELPAKFESWDDVQGPIRAVHDQFAESREALTDAKDSVGTTYFADDVADAKELSENCLKSYADLKNAITLRGTPEILARLEREYDIKFKQLQAELDEVMELCHDDD